MKYSSSSFLWYLSLSISAIGILIFEYYEDHFEKGVLVFSVGALMTFYASRKISKLRIANLKEFSKDNGYDYFNKPTELQLDEFKGFKSIQEINESGSESFSNLLVPSLDQKFNRGFKPIIITSFTSISKRRHFESGRDVKYTQIFLYRTNSKLPKFYLRPTSSKIFSIKMKDVLNNYEKIKMGIDDYKKIEIHNNKFPIKAYDLYSPNNEIKKYFEEEFIDLLNRGVKKDSFVNIESNGESLIFFIKHERHTVEGIKFYINLFNAMTKAMLR